MIKPTVAELKETIEAAKAVVRHAVGTTHDGHYVSLPKAAYLRLARAVGAAYTVKHCSPSCKKCWREP